MEVKLSKMLIKPCAKYIGYLTRTKDGEARVNARDFSNIKMWENILFEDCQTEDVLDGLIELANAKMIELYISNGFVVETNAIIYMENRFKNGLSEVLDFIGKIKGLIPFV